MLAGGAVAGTPSPTGTTLPAVPSGTPTPAVTPVPAPGPSPTQPPTAHLVTTLNVPFTPEVTCSDSGAQCRLGMDIVRPSGGGPWPVFLLLPGGPGAVNGEDYMLSLADALAQRGGVAIVADWRQSASVGGGSPSSFADVTCALGVTRHIASGYGGDPGNVTLVGHSLGGWGGAVVSFTPTAILPQDGTCDAMSGSLRPDAFVTLDGAMDEPTDMEDGADYVTAFFGGARAALSAAWDAGDPFAILRHWPAADDAIPILVVQASDDTVVDPAVATSFHAALLTAGYPNRLMIITGGHGGALVSGAVADAIVGLRKGS